MSELDIPLLTADVFYGQRLIVTSVPRLPEVIVHISNSVRFCFREYLRSLFFEFHRHFF